MKKRILAFGLIGILLFSSCASSITENKQNQKTQTVSKEEKVKQEIENPDFRNCKWGMTREEVKKYETDISIFLDEKDIISATTKIGSTDFNITYYFNNNKLVKCAMVLTEKHSNENLFIDDYEDFQKLIIEKYGEPKQDKKIWNNNLYKDKPDDWGFAISLGDLTMLSQWLTDTTEVGLILNGDNYKITLGIIYQDINYEEETDISGI